MRTAGTCILERELTEVQAQSHSTHGLYGEERFDAFLGGHSGSGRFHSGTTAGEVQRGVHAIPASTERVSVVGVHCVTAHRVGSDPPTLPAPHDSLPPQGFDKVADPNPQQSDRGRMYFARLLVIKSDLDLGRLVHRNIKVLVPSVRFRIMRPGSLGTVDFDEYESVDARFGSRT